MIKSPGQNVETSNVEKTAALKIKNKDLENEIKERKKIEKSINSLNDCLASFTTDYNENIQKIVNTASVSLKSCYTTYNKVIDGKLTIVNSWQLPHDFEITKANKNHICYDSINSSSSGNIIAVEDIGKTQYAKIDPNISKYKIKSYLNCSVKYNDREFGSLCVIFTKKQNFSKHEKKIISLLAKFIEIEEGRKRSEEKMIKSYSYLAKINRKITILANFKSSKSNNFSEICDYITSSAINFSSSNKALLYVKNDSKFELSSYQGFVRSEIFQIEQDTLKIKTLVDKLKKRQHRLQIDLDSKKKSDIIKLYDLSSILALPLITKDDFVGILLLFFQHDLIPNNQELELYEVLANQAAANIEDIIEQKTSSKQMIAL